MADGTFLEIRANAVKVKAQAARYSLLNEVLYRHSFLGPYLRCLLRGEAMLVMEQVHLGVCRTHIGGGKLCHQIIT